MRKATVRGLFAALAFFLACGLYGQKAGDFELSLEGNGVTITGYKGSAAEVHIPAQVEGIPVTAIGERAFYECSSLERITIPAGVTAIGDEAFANCRNLTSITVDLGNRQYTGVNGILFSKDGTSLLCYPAGKGFTSYTIPAGVTAIGKGAFFDCSSLERITIPGSVTAIGDEAFYDCSSLERITIPAGVTAIGDEAFSRCSSLKSITIPNSVTAIGDSAFYDCRSLVSITIPAGVTTIGYGAFADCSNLESLAIPAGVTTIGVGVFSRCISLTSITVDPGNRQYTDINGILFSKDGTSILCYPPGNGFTSYTIPAGVTAIGYEAFHDCDSLESITIPNSVTAIGDEAFSRCSSLKSITIPNSVTAIGYEAFSRCSSLKSITIPNSVTAIGDSAFFVCRSLVNIAIPASVTAIGDEAFAGCISLTSITVDPGNRQYISVNGILFSKDGTSILCYPPGNGFTSYTIPAGVTAIGEGAFSGCSSLSSADREAIRRRFGNGVF